MRGNVVFFGHPKERVTLEENPEQGPNTKSPPYASGEDLHHSFVLSPRGHTGGVVLAYTCTAGILGSIKLQGSAHTEVRELRMDFITRQLGESCIEREELVLKML